MIERKPSNQSLTIGRFQVVVVYAKPRRIGTELDVGVLMDRCGFSALEYAISGSEPNRYVCALINEKYCSASLAVNKTVLLSRQVANGSG